jgi:hypothetical protein
MDDLGDGAVEFRRNDAVDRHASWSERASGRSSTMGISFSSAISRIFNAMRSTPLASTKGAPPSERT